MVSLAPLQSDPLYAGFSVQELVARLTCNALIFLEGIKKKKKLGGGSFLPFLGPLPRHLEARGQIGATAAGLRRSHSNAGSEPSLRPTPQLTATPDRQPTEQDQGSNLQPHGS